MNSSASAHGKALWELEREAEVATLAKVVVPVKSRTDSCRVPGIFDRCCRFITFTELLLWQSGPSPRVTSNSAATAIGTTKGM